MLTMFLIGWTVTAVCCYSGCYLYVIHSIYNLMIVIVKLVLTYISVFAIILSCQVAVNIFVYK